jgi:hypothetical protein
MEKLINMVHILSATFCHFEAVKSLQMNLTNKDSSALLENTLRLHNKDQSVLFIMRTYKPCKCIVSKILFSIK